MYITLSSIKRSFGFNGIELSDFFIGLPTIIISLIFLCITSFPFIGISTFIMGVFLLLPVKVSQKNRMYKVLYLVFKFLFSEKEFTLL